MKIRVFAFLLMIGLAAQAQTPPGMVDPGFLSRLVQRYRAQPAAFEFAAIGDQQYGLEGEQKFPALRNSINAAREIAFTVHTGDIKSGSTLCSDAMFADRLAQFNLFEAPMILTPGDNEWTDCHRANNGSYNSLERLAHLRRVFFPTDESLGRRKMMLTRQSEDPRYTLYRENALWTMGNIVFATVHIVGSNNNLGRDAENDREYEARNEANLNWIRTAFSLARDGRFGGVVLVIQANPSSGAAEGFGGVANIEAGFWDSMFVLEDETIVFGKPVLLVHGDSHFFRIDKALTGRRSGRTLDNFVRLEVPGSTLVHWVRVKVNPAKPATLWSFEHEDVPENYPTQQRP